MFGTYNEKLAGAFFGTGAKAEALSVAMMESWIAFARNGDPSNATTGPWPRYDASSRKTMIFGDGNPHIAEAPNEVRRKAWTQMPETVIGP